MQDKAKKGLAAYRYCQDREAERISEYQCLCCKRHFMLGGPTQEPRYCPYCGSDWPDGQAYSRPQHIPRWQWDLTIGPYQRGEITGQELQARQESIGTAKDRVQERDQKLRQSEKRWRYARARREADLRKLAEMRQKLRPTGDTDAAGCRWFHVATQPLRCFTPVWARWENGQEDVAELRMTYFPDIATRWHCPVTGDFRPADPVAWYGSEENCEKEDCVKV